MIGPLLAWALWAPACPPVIIEHREIRGASMVGVAPAGATVRVERGHYRCQPVVRGDLVIVQPPRRPTPIIKRVRGLPGDRLAVTKAGGVSIDDVPLRTAAGTLYRLAPARQRMLRLYEGVIPPDAYLLLGEQPAGSTDATRFGLVSRADLLGRAQVVPTP